MGFDRDSDTGETLRSMRLGSLARRCRRTVVSVALRMIGPVSFLLACTMALKAAPAGDAHQPTELDTEAAFLTRLAPFVDWPLETFSSGESPLVICAVATDPLARRLAGSAEPRRNGKRPIRVRVVGVFDALDNCHILYLGAAGDSAIRFARAVRDRPVLTVLRSNGDRYESAIIVFAVDHGRVRFDIDDANATSSRLAISSKLLALARNVTPASATQ